MFFLIGLMVKGFGLLLAAGAGLIVYGYFT